MIPLMTRTRTDRRRDNPHISPLGVFIFMLCIVTGGVVTAVYNNPAGVIAAALVGLYFLFAIRVAAQWEKVALLRLGRYVGLRGPGVFMIVPIIDQTSTWVDQRIRVTSVNAESALTRDTVPVNVDAIIFWLVWNAEKAILEVMNFDQAIETSAQTALRESIGRA